MASGAYCPVGYKVSSSNIQAVGYLPASRELVVLFKEAPGDFYVYKDVPANIADELMSAQSVGTYLNISIKKGPYPWARLEGTAFTRETETRWPGTTSSFLNLVYPPTPTLHPVADFKPDDTQRTYAW